ncbi:hypothetical protein J7E43_05665 [Bacillus sp. ISL-8]|nr:hypothetical protein [Bacillus sp. ISL-8]
MFRFLLSTIISFVTAAIVLVVSKDFIFRRFPEAKPIYEEIKSMFIEIYGRYGWEGLLVVTVAVIGLSKAFDKKG